MASTDSPRVPPAVPTSAAQPSAARAAEGERLRSVGLPGLTLSVRSRSGAREGLPPALYVHGLGGSSQNWSALMPLLADLVDGEAVDLPGFGASPPPDDGNYSVTGHARAVIRYLDSQNRGPVHLFGNSLGGAVTTRVAAARPDLVRTLTLVSPALPEIRVQRTAVPTGLLAIPGVAGLFTRLTRDWTPEQRVRGVMALCYGDPNRVTPEGFRSAVDEMERRLQLPYFWDAMARSARGVVNAYTLGGQHGLWRQAERVLAPTLLVYGGRDLLVSYRMAARAARAFRDSRLLTLPDAGHVAMMEYPTTVATAFRELLADTAAGAEFGALYAERGAAASRTPSSDASSPGASSPSASSPSTPSTSTSPTSTSPASTSPASTSPTGTSSTSTPSTSTSNPES
ncbi:alpha/beta fold hydrolase [Streptomyces beihaiensis]|uniref:Alpha/beta hydrolase n=1 Tax=Streptomyces beihaiensis TaxID=2984495 RepID=A0ABT3TQS6_9ACTN|nr:alpha/beta hydrolase [Streptomyces beihaiensis]MCX3059399.1 alpha/beta hydrolase [Streptomyces beihaiensis]